MEKTRMVWLPNGEKFEDDFAKFFRNKVDNIRTSTASANPPVIIARQPPPLSFFEPAKLSEIVRLMNNTPAKSCESDRIQ